MDFHHFGWLRSLVAIPITPFASSFLMLLPWALAIGQRARRLVRPQVQQLEPQGLVSWQCYWTIPCSMASTQAPHPFQDNWGPNGTDRPLVEGQKIEKKRVTASRVAGYVRAVRVFWLKIPSKMLRVRYQMVDVNIFHVFSLLLNVPEPSRSRRLGWGSD